MGPSSSGARRARVSCTLLVLAATLEACSIPPSSTSVASAASLSHGRRQAGGAGKITHVVVIVQENRSFDNLFYGYPGADTATSGKNSLGQTIQLFAEPLEGTYNLGHRSVDFFAACDGTGSLPGTSCKMDAFDKEMVVGSAPPNPQYAYVPQSETKPYFDIAHEFVLADRMFTSHVDASFVSHQYLIAAQANDAVDLPTSKWGCGGGKSDLVQTLTATRTYGGYESPCFNSLTIGDELDAKGLPWRYYSYSGSFFTLSAYQAIKHIRYGPDWKTDIVRPSPRFLKDVASGQLAAVTWITPTCANSDHAGCLGNAGPDWVASLINAVGESPFWDTTTIFVMWDEWGGWYDHVPPPFEDFDGLGIRVPLLIVSPYAKQNFVSHLQYEHGSILKYIENVFDLAPLAASDTRANSPDAEAFDYHRKPRAFVPIKTQRGSAYFSSEPLDPRPPDDV